MSVLNKSAWFLFAFMAVGVGLYPLVYLLVDMSTGLLGTKSTELLNSWLWSIAFYQHILLGGLALIIGWVQFKTSWRKKYISTHRRIGKVYLIAALLSGMAGFYLSFFATAGLVAQFGFCMLAVLWFFSTLKAYQTIKLGQVDNHQKWMIRSYALCFSAVSLRIFLPVLTILFGLKFSEAYQIVAWLCWIPNLIIAEIIIKNLRL